MTYQNSLYLLLMNGYKTSGCQAWGGPFHRPCGAFHPASQSCRCALGAVPSASPCHLLTVARVVGPADVERLWLVLLGLSLRLVGHCGLRPGVKEGPPSSLDLSCGQERLTVPPPLTVLGQQVIRELGEDVGLLLRAGQVRLAVVGHAEELFYGLHAKVLRHCESEGHPHGPQGQSELPDVQDVVGEVVPHSGRLGGRSGSTVVDVEQLDGHLVTLGVVELDPPS